jgi:hypothetical protein
VGLCVGVCVGVCGCVCMGVCVVVCECGCVCVPYGSHHKSSISTDPWRLNNHQSRGPPQATHPGALLQFRCVWPKRWQRLHCIAPFGATYVLTVTRKPQGLVRDRTFVTSGPSSTDTMMCGLTFRLWQRPDCDAQSGAASLPGRLCPGHSASPEQRFQACFCLSFDQQSYTAVLRNKYMIYSRRGLTIDI